MTSDLAAALRGSLAALSSQRRLLLADSGASGQGFVARATLRHLHRHGPRTVSSIAFSERVTTQAVSSRIMSLEEAGLVERRRADQDARRTVVTATPAGVAVVDGAERRASVALSAALSRLPDSDRIALDRAVPALEALAADLAGAAS